ncbi:hypothetical protein RSAG8_07888, partial [Rhizoctonia solani AG-8 WAC10335]
MACIARGLCLPSRISVPSHHPHPLRLTPYFTYLLCFSTSPSIAIRTVRALGDPADTSIPPDGGDE